ncbi:pyruvate formate-lyase-activating protein [Atopobiaceae bacterium 24-176]
MERTEAEKIEALRAVTGRIHSIETMGTVDGPGTRLVAFCQGCPMRCAYCHNPDSWDSSAGSVTTAGEVLDLFERNRPFYRRGGITLSGGEPMLQPDFAAAVFALAHRAPAGRIHTCLDTSGIAFSPSAPERHGALLDECDLVLLDVKHADENGHRALTGMGCENPRALGDELARRNIPVVVRHVVVPGITDGPEELAALGRLIAAWDNVVGLDLLPYHTMGVEKYRALGLDYPLEGVEPQDKVAIPALRRTVLAARACAQRQQAQ